MEYLVKHVALYGALLVCACGVSEHTGGGPTWPRQIFSQNNFSTGVPPPYLQLFTTFSWGISAMARLSFGFLEYDEFVNVSGPVDRAPLLLPLLLRVAVVALMADTCLAAHSHRVQAMLSLQKSTDGNRYSAGTSPFLVLYYIASPLHMQNGAGLGQYDEAMVVFFWLSVLLLVLIVQNTLLAVRG